MENEDFFFCWNCEFFLKKIGTLTNSVKFLSIMKILPISFSLLGLVLPVTGQNKANLTGLDEVALKWQIEIPEPISYGAPSNPFENQDSIDFKLISSQTKKVDVLRVPEMHDLPPITGRINVTVRMVQDPELPEPVEPLSALDPDDPAVVAQMDELREEYQGASLVFISASVYDHERTLLRIHTNSKTGGEVTAWSNLDFNHFSGFSTYRVKDGVDGRFYDYGILMGLGNEETHAMAEIDSRSDMKYKVPRIAKLPDLAESGPSFKVMKGKADSPAMAALEQIHDLYRKEGKKMEAAFYAREKARAERKAYLLANPPKPDDVTISFWKKSKRPTVAPARTAE
ncbi:MAG: hypothetical protein ACSHX7_04420 [Luteolibacter sp.]